MQAVGQLIAHLFLLGCQGFFQFFARFPLHEGQEFGGLDDQRDGQFLGRVKLSPVSLVAMAENTLGQLGQGGGVQLSVSRPATEWCCEYRRSA